MVKHLDGGIKFLMYPRFVQVFLNNQVECMDRHSVFFVISSYTKKVFANIKREGKDFSRKVTPLFATMMVQASKDIGEGSETSTDTHHTPIVTQPSSSLPQNKQKSRRKQRKEIDILHQVVRFLLRKGYPQLPMINYLLFGVNDLDGNEVIVDVTAGENVEQSTKVVEKEVSTTDLVTTAGEVVTTAGIKVTTTATTPQISKDELTLAQTLIEIKASKPKAITTAVGTRPKAKGIVMQEPKLEKGSDKAVEDSEKAKEGSSKRVGSNLEQEDAKRQSYTLSSKSPTIVDYKIYKEGKKSYFKIIRVDGTSQSYQTFGKIFKNFNREDLEVLWSIVKTRFKKTNPIDDMNNLLFQTLKTVFEHHVEDNI
nr:hypothetical protein [Tanacetum cinerariifolium]